MLFPGNKLTLKWERVYRVGAGLHNLGNTCFLNSTVQCLTYTPPLANYLLSKEHSRTCKYLIQALKCLNSPVFLNTVHAYMVLSYGNDCGSVSSWCPVCWRACTNVTMECELKQLEKKNKDCCWLTTLITFIPSLKQNSHESTVGEIMRCTKTTNWIWTSATELCFMVFVVCYRWWRCREAVFTVCTSQVFPWDGQYIILLRYEMKDIQRYGYD